MFFLFSNSVPEIELLTQPHHDTQNLSKKTKIVSNPRAERDRIETARREEAAAWGGKLSALQSSFEEQMASLRVSHAAEINAMQAKEQSVRENDIQRIDSVRKDSAKEMAAYKQRMEAELVSEREKLRQERAASLIQMEQELSRREAAAREHLERTREEEMEMIISKLDSEYAASRAESDALCSQRVKAAEEAARMAKEKIQSEHDEKLREGQVREARLHQELRDSASIQSGLEREVDSMSAKLSKVETSLKDKVKELEDLKANASTTAQQSAERYGEQIGAMQQRLKDEARLPEESEP